MITILLVAPPTEELAELAAGDSSRELLFASGPEEAVEKLARNRRIDAVLIMAFPEGAETVRVIREELSPPPPLFAPSWARLEGVQGLPGEDAKALLEAVASALEVK